MTPADQRQIRAAITAALIGVALALIGAAGYGTTAGAGLLIVTAIATTRPADRP